MVSDKSPLPSTAELQAAEGFVVEELNGLADLLAMGVEFYWQDGNAPCTDGDGRVGLPRYFTTRAEVIDIRDGVAHELCAHVHDQITDPSYVQNLKRWESSTSSPLERGVRHAFTNNLTDIVGNNWKAALLPRLGADQEEVYQRILFPDADLRDRPKSLQLIHKWLRDAMVVDEPAQVDDDVQAIHDEVADMIRLTSDRRNATNEERFDIWTELVWPKLAPLLEHDMQQPQQLTQAVTAAETGHQHACAGLHEVQIPVRPSNAGASTEAPQSTLLDAVKQAQMESSSGGSRGAGMRAEREALTGYSAESRQIFYNVLQKYASTLDELDMAFRQFFSQEVTQHARYRPGKTGAEVAAGTLAIGYVESLAGVVDPAIWQTRFWQEKIKPGPGPFDLWIWTDATGSMKNPDPARAIMASEGTALLSMSFERYNTAAREFDIPEEYLSRCFVGTFTGVATIEKELSAFGTEKEHLDAFHHVREAKGANTLIHAAVQATIDADAEPPTPRRRQVIIISDGADANKAETTIKIADLEKLGYEVQIWNISGTSSGLPNEVLVSSPAELPARMLAIADNLVPIDKRGGN